MLVEIENSLVAGLKAKPLGKRLRQIDTLPDLNGDSLVKRFLTDAPAAYVALGSFPVRNRYAHLKAGVACVARNSRGQGASRHGDGKMIGLLEMIEQAMAALDGMTIVVGAESIAFEVTSCDMMNSETRFEQGVYVAVIQLQSSSEVMLPDDLGTLAEFKTFHADYDIEPHETSAEHDKWLREPPNYGSTKPELSDQLNLRE